MKILVIEDEPDMLDNIVGSLEAEKYVVETAATFDAALEKIYLYHYDCILLDISLPCGNGQAILVKLKKQTPHKALLLCRHATRLMIKCQYCSAKNH